MPAFPKNGGFVPRNVLREATAALKNDVSAVAEIACQLVVEAFFEVCLAVS